MKKVILISLILSLVLGNAVFSSHDTHKSCNEKTFTQSLEEPMEESFKISEEMNSTSEFETKSVYYSENDAIALISEKEQYDIQQLTVGYMNENVYLVNALNIEEGTIENLFLVVNGKMIDKKFQEDGQESETFVENYERYQ